MLSEIPNVSNLVLTYIVTYGPILVAVLLAIGAMGIPIPGTLIVIACGAFVEQDFLPLTTTFLAALAGAVTGDSISYSIGYFAKNKVPQKIKNSRAWNETEKRFLARSSVTIYLTRWILTPLALPTNLLAGITGYKFKKYLLFDALGEITWVLLFGTLGFMFSTQWEVINDLIQNFTGVAVGLAIIVTVFSIIKRR